VDNQFLVKPNFLVGGEAIKNLAGVNQRGKGGRPAESKRLGKNTPIGGFLLGGPSGGESREYPNRLEPFSPLSNRSAKNEKKKGERPKGQGLMGF